MGSRFTILNDTRHDVLVKHTINCQFFIRPVDVVHAGLINAAQGSDSIPLEFFNGVLERLLDMLNREVEEDRNDMSSAKLIKPGEKYTWFGTLSLHMRVYVRNDMQQSDDRVCFTGPIVGFENVYPISEHFTNLDV